MPRPRKPQEPEFVQFDTLVDAVEGLRLAAVLAPMLEGHTTQAQLAGILILMARVIVNEHQPEKDEEALALIVEYIPQMVEALRSHADILPLPGLTTVQ